MPKLSQLADYQSPFLKAADLAGQARRVQIAGVELTTMKQNDGTSQAKLVVAFVGKAKKLVLNRTNAQALAAGLGDDTDAWHGAEIILTPARTNQGMDTISATAIPLADGRAPVMARQPIAQQAQQRRPVAAVAVADAPEWPDRDYDNEAPAGVDDGDPDGEPF